MVKSRKTVTIDMDVSFFLSVVHMYQISPTSQLEWPRPKMECIPIDSTSHAEVM